MIKNTTVYGILILGIFLLLGSILVSYKSISLQLFGQRALGTIQNIIPDETQVCGKYGCTYYDLLNIKFTDVDNKAHLSSISVNYKNDQFKIGDNTNIWYAKNDPQLVSFDKGGTEAIWGIILFALALIAFFFSFYYSKKTDKYWSK